MPHPRYPNGEISERGEAIYEQSLRAKVETEENIGKIISIDIETGDYEIDTDILAPAQVYWQKSPMRQFMANGLATTRLSLLAVLCIGLLNDARKSH